MCTRDTRPLKAGEDYTLFPQYSAGGKSIFYVSNARHRFRIWRQPLAPNSDAEPLAAAEVRIFAYLKTGAFSTFFNPVTPHG